MIKNNIKIILASASSRRTAMLKGIGLPFTSRESRIEEELQPLVPAHEQAGALAIAIACMKADDVGQREKRRALIIAADTIVVMGKKVIGKPSDRGEAGKILRLLSGKTHKVITGVCILKMPERISLKFSVTTDVTMVKMTDRDIRWYIKTGEPMDKAGAYGIQGIGGLFVKKINGSYTNVVGLPLPELLMALKKLKAIEMVG
jgi:septum formation protein